MLPVPRAFLFFLTLLPVSHVSPPAASAGERALAVFTETTGRVELRRRGLKEQIHDGSFLFRNDVVITGPRGKTTLLLRDGSRIRLFEQSRFLINHEKVSENPAGRINRRMRLHSGTILVLLLSANMQAEIQSGPGILIRVNGGILRVFHREKENTISITKGEAWIRNRLSSVKLDEGQRLDRVKDTDYLSEHATPIPHVFRLHSDPLELAFAEEKPVSAFLELQLKTRLTDRDVHRKGPVRLWSSYSRLSIPREVKLDSRGHAHVRMRISPPDRLTGLFDGTIRLFASMDSAGFEQVAEGQLLLRVSGQDP